MKETSHRPRLLHVLVDAERGGCERDSFFLCKYMVSTCHDIVVLGKNGPMSEDWESVGASVTHLGVMKMGRYRRGLHLRKAFAGLCSNAVVIWHGMAELPAILHALPAHCGPVLIHGGNPATSLRLWTDLRYLAMEQLWPNSHDPIYVCCSHHVADSFEGSFYLKRFRRTVITNGVEHEAEIVHQPRPFLPDKDTVTIGMMARLDSIKDHPCLIQAMSEVIKIIPRARLELAGDGGEMQALQALATKLGMEKFVTFLGSVSNVYETISRWDLFAYAATPQEGFGNAVAEALMCGLPSVVSDLPPLHEVCGNDEAVIYVPARDPSALAAALVKLAGNLERRRQLSEAARRHALAELSADVFAKRYARLLEAEEGRLRTGPSNDDKQTAFSSERKS